MASWQAKHRDPLFDQSTQAALERRGKELAGAGLVTLAVALAAMLLSWTPEDPGFLAATDAPAQNWLGGIGAYVASALMMIAGFGAWALVVGACVWGLRMMFHRGEERLMRALFVPILAATVSVYAAVVTPPAAWTQSFGLGGHFGDMVTGAILGMLPVKAQIGIRLVELGSAMAILMLGAFVLGFDRRELMGLGRFLAAGLATSYAVAMTLVGRGATASVRAARGVRTRAEARRARLRAAGAEGDGLDGPAAAASAGGLRAGLLPRLRGGGMAAEEALPEHELVERAPLEDGEAPTEEHVRGSILAAVAARLARPRPVRAVSSDPGADGDWTEEELEASAVAMPNGPGPASAPFGEGRSRVVVAPARAPAPSARAGPRRSRSSPSRPRRPATSRRRCRC